MEKLLLVKLTLLRFLTAIGCGIFWPFLPAEGKRKNLTATEVGIIMAAISAMNALTAVIVGKGLKHIGCKFTLILGGAIQGIFSIQFGTLIDLPNGNNFFILSLIEASMMGLGVSMSMISCCSIVAIYFRNSISAAQGILETAFFSGVTIAPALGGFLFSIGGYKVPFYAIGFTILASNFMIAIFLPVTDEYRNEPEQETGQSKKTIKDLLENPKMLVLSSVIIISTVAMRAISVLLPLHLQEDLKLSVVHTGLVFMARSSVYFISANVVGYWYRKEWMKSLYLVGLALLVTSYLLLALNPLIPNIYRPIQLWLTMLSLAGTGVSVSIIITPGLENVLHVAIDSGHADSLDTYLKVATLYEIDCAIGELLGPVLGGILLDSIGYQWAVTTIAILMIPVIIVLWIFT